MFRIVRTSTQRLEAAQMVELHKRAEYYRGRALEAEHANNNPDDPNQPTSEEPTT
ncbi:hypothetical protein OG582_40755 (plasmid) [Streptomyces anulatus]|uniref:hypothetical protein n=1 Tax=Streptomyces anulatus TaxID=1892 RepID=UPI00325561A8